MEKVSILSQCYNDEKYLKNFLDCILRQTYQNIELIIVNDGSSDNSENILKEYEKKMQEKNISFQHFYQENQGQAAAVNFGLKKVTGEFFAWMDCDDILCDDSIEMKVDFLKKHPDIVWLRSKALIFDIDNPKEPIGCFERKQGDKIKEDLFRTALFPNNDFYFGNLTYMVRTKELFEVIPDREIFVNRGGQNWQIILPLAYKYPCGYLDKVTAHYMVRENSHSHEIEGNIRKIIDRSYLHEEILVETLKNIGFKQNSQEIKEVKQKYSWVRLYQTVYNKEKQYFEKIFQKEHELKWRYNIFKIIKINALAVFIIKIMNRLKRKEW